MKCWQFAYSTLTRSVVYSSFNECLLFLTEYITSLSLRRVQENFCLRLYTTLALALALTLLAGCVHHSVRQNFLKRRVVSCRQPLQIIFWFVSEDCVCCFADGVLSRRVLYWVLLNSNCPSLMCGVLTAFVSYQFEVWCSVREVTDEKLMLIYTNTNTNTTDGIRGAVIMTELLQKFSCFIWWIQNDTKWLLSLRLSQPTWVHL